MITNDMIIQSQAQSKQTYKDGDYLLLPHLPYADSLARESDPAKQPCPELYELAKPGNCDENGDARWPRPETATSTPT